MASSNTWKLKRDKHAWAFFYYLQRKGDCPVVRVHSDTIEITINDPTPRGFFLTED